MIASSVSASSMPRLPVSWREFTELLQLRVNESSRPSKASSVETAKKAGLDIRFNESSNQQDQHRFSTKQNESPACKTGAPNGATFNPCDSPPVRADSGSSEYPEGIDLLA